MRFLDYEYLERIRESQAPSNGMLPYDLDQPDWVDDEPGGYSRFFSDLLLELAGNHKRWNRALRARVPPANKAKRVHIGQHNARALKRGLPASLTLEDWEHVVDCFGGTCAYCRDATATVLEHVIPVSQGGGTETSNIVPACSGCNSKKGRKDAYAWLGPERFAEFLRVCVAVTADPDEEEEETEAKTPTS